MLVAPYDLIFQFDGRIILPISICKQQYRGKVDHSDERIASQIHSSKRQRANLNHLLNYENLHLTVDGYVQLPARTALSTAM